MNHFLPQQILLASKLHLILGPPARFLKIRLLLRIGIVCWFGLVCRASGFDKYNFDEDRYVNNISFSNEIIIHSELTERFMPKGLLPVSEGSLNQKRIMKERHQIVDSIHAVTIDEDFSETKREYKIGVKFPFYGQTSRTDYPLQGRALFREYKNSVWMPFSLAVADGSSNVGLALEAYNLDHNALSLSYPNKDIGIGYTWNQTNSVETAEGKTVTCSYRVELESIERFSGYLCAKFKIHQRRTEISSSSELSLESDGYSYRSIEYNLDVASDFNFNASYQEFFERDGEAWCMTRTGRGQIKQLVDSLQQTQPAGGGGNDTSPIIYNFDGSSKPLPKAL